MCIRATHTEKHGLADVASAVCCGGLARSYWNRRSPNVVDGMWWRHLAPGMGDHWRSVCVAKKCEQLAGEPMTAD